MLQAVEVWEWGICEIKGMGEPMRRRDHEWGNARLTQYMGGWMSGRMEQLRGMTVEERRRLQIVNSRFGRYVEEERC